MELNQFEQAVNDIQVAHDHNVELWRQDETSGEITWAVMQNGIRSEKASTLNTLREVVNNYLYGVNSPFVLHPDGIRRNEEGVAYNR